MLLCSTVEDEGSVLEKLEDGVAVIELDRGWARIVVAVVGGKGGELGRLKL